MRRLLFVIVTLCTAMSYASDIECIGIATQVHNGRDTWYVFKDEIALRSSWGEVDWYDQNGQLVASNIDEIYPDEGIYRIQKNGVFSSPFRVKRYDNLDNLSFTVETNCNTTILHVSGLDASARTYSLKYNTLSWNGDAWEDSLVQKSGNLTANIDLYEPLYAPTTITLCYDDEVRANFGLEPACVSVEVPASDIKAVKTNLIAYATPHRAETEKENEMKAYKAQMTLDASNSYSGPLEIAFYSNPTPAAQFFTWTIKKAEEVIVTRHDKDIRYTFSFSEPSPAGTRYTVECQVNNATCDSEKEKIEVNISKSDLRVPNFFSPNGDGANDEFRVAYQSLKSFHCEIYNRWGKKVFQWDDPSKGWDGTIYGKPAAEGAYFYIIHAVGTDDLVYKRSGDINLLRGK